MNKITIKSFGLVIVLTILIGILFLLFNGTTGETIRNYSWTKAICNETNHCRDYEIVCNGKEVVSIAPTGAVIQNSPNWKDLRDEETINKFCE